MHAVTKEAAIWRPPYCHAGGHDTVAEPQSMVNEEADRWVNIWQAGDTPVPPPWGTSVPEGASLPRPEPQVLREAAGGFVRHMGVGSDLIHPRWLLALSDVLLTILSTIMLGAEAVGNWPRGLILFSFSWLRWKAGGDLLACCRPSSGCGRRCGRTSGWPGVVRGI